MSSYRGDVTGTEEGVPDGQITLADAIYLSNHVAYQDSGESNPYSLPSFESGDVTGAQEGVPDGQITLADAIYLSNHVAYQDSGESNPYQLPSSVTLFQLVINSSSAEAELIVDTSQIPDTVDGISGIQLYIKDVKLSNKTSDQPDLETYFYTNYNKSKLGEGWIVASNYFEDEDLSIIYLEKDNDTKIKRNDGIFSLNTFSFTEKGDLPSILKSSGNFISRVVDVMDNEIITIDF